MCWNWDVSSKTFQQTDINLAEVLWKTFHRRCFINIISFMDVSSKMFHQRRFIEDVSSKAFNQRMSHRRRFIYRRFIKDIYNQRTFHRIHLIKGRFIEDVQSTDVTSTTLLDISFHWTGRFTNIERMSAVISGQVIGLSDSILCMLRLNKIN